jgi:hypothetical protein
MLKGGGIESLGAAASNEPVMPALDSFMYLVSIDPVRTSPGYRTSQL